MRRSIVLALVTALLAVGLLVGCDDDDNGGGNGGDDAAELKERFDTGYRPINDEFLALGKEVGEVISTAKGQSDAALATKFKSLATRVAALKPRLDRLEPPPEYEEDAKRVSEAMALVGRDLDEIALAADAGDAAAARTHTQDLVRHSEEVRIARRKLARRTGAKV